ncbi:MAG: hypothetical protein KKD39_02350 [Candidatus Altiarchaeota archaeon]|nr:hypothetical protein [Candidatus Altiarchaeota archaeon]
MKKHGMMGIGALIIFIALILVAAIAAAVLITTGGSLQQKALVTGVQTEEGVTSGIEVTNVIGSDAADATSHRIGDFKMMMRVKSGSSGLNMNNTILTIDTDDASNTRTYGGVLPTDSTTASTQNFMVYYVQYGPNYQPGYLNRGDTINMVFHVENEITENQQVRLKIIPRVGQYTQVDFFTPDSMTQQNINLWPN